MLCVLDKTVSDCTQFLRFLLSFHLTSRTTHHILLIDDFLANGEAATGAIRLLRMTHATIAGLGVLIEKSFQPGRRKVEEAGVEVYALARIGKLGTDFIQFL